MFSQSTWLFDAKALAMLGYQVVMTPLLNHILSCCHSIASPIELYPLFVPINSIPSSFP